MAAEKSSRRQIRFWLVLYWIAGALGAILLSTAPIALALSAIPTDTAPTPTTIVFTFGFYLGAASPLVGAILATRLAGLTSAGRFLKATSNIRVTAIAWASILPLILLVVAVGAGHEGRSIGEAVGEVLDANPGIGGAIGGLSILLLLGPGLSDYRVAREELIDPVTPPAQD